MKNELINSLNIEVEKLIEVVKIQKNKIEILENELLNKNQQINFLKSQLNVLIIKIEKFNKLFSELPVYKEEENDEKKEFENWEE